MHLYMEFLKDYLAKKLIFYPFRFACPQFPLAAQRPDMRLATAKEHTAGFRPRNPMEEQIAALLHGSKSTVRNSVRLI